jgi:hypothetical protein
MKRFITPLVALALFAASCSDDKKDKKEERPLAGGPNQQHNVAPVQEIPPLQLEELPPLPPENPFAGIPVVSFYTINEALRQRHIPLFSEFGTNLGVTTNNRWDVVRYVKPITKQTVRSYTMISNDRVIGNLIGGQRVCLQGTDATGRRVESRHVVASPSHTDELRSYCEYTESNQSFKLNEGQEMALSHLQLIGKNPNQFKFISIAAFHGIPDLATTPNLFFDRCGIHSEVVPVAMSNYILSNNALNMGRMAIINQHSVAELGNGSRHKYMIPSTLNTCRVIRQVPVVNEYGAETAMHRAMWVAQYDLVPLGNPDHVIRITYEIEADSIQQSEGFLIDELVLDMWELLPRAR